MQHLSPHKIPSPSGRKLSVKALLINDGIKLTDIAQRLKVSLPTVSKVISGKEPRSGYKRPLPRPWGPRKRTFGRTTGKNYDDLCSAHPISMGEFFHQVNDKSVKRHLNFRGPCERRQSRAVSGCK